MTTPDADSIAELIDDCAQLPTTFRDPDHPTEPPDTVTAWHVSDGCVAQVSELDEYV